ncbi:hypothetical protein A2U01_0103749, partial [Trifolium medium]|nr:hypothetical protein [Trifolium medium]
QVLMVKLNYPKGKKEQELMDKHLLTFKEGRPKVKDSPLPGYAGSSAKAI